MAFDHPFYFLRHGETTWNAGKRIQGQLNSPLSELGWEQARAAGRAMRDEPIERIVASPLDRAFFTAQEVSKVKGIEVVFDRDLMECHLGDHQDEPHGPWLAEYFEGRYEPPNGEPFPEFCERVWGAMQRAVSLGPNTLIVAHGGLWLAARQYVTVDPDLKRMPNALPLHVLPSKDLWVHRICGGVEPAKSTESL
ncbi:MAG: histidine phosphatase family protein [Pseudomonadota bacterium]